MAKTIKNELGNVVVIDTQNGKTLRGCTKYAELYYLPDKQQYAVVERDVPNNGAISDGPQYFSDRRAANKAYAQLQRFCLTY